MRGLNQHVGPQNGLFLGCWSLVLIGSRSFHSCPAFGRAGLWLAAAAWLCWCGLLRRRDSEQVAAPQPYHSYSLKEIGTVHCCLLSKYKRCIVVEGCCNCFAKYQVSTEFFLNSLPCQLSLSLYLIDWANCRYSHTSLLFYFIWLQDVIPTVLLSHCSVSLQTTHQ